MPRAVKRKRKRASPKRHPVEQYVADVRSGKIPTGRLVRLAVDRYVRDRRTGKKRGLKFDREAAQTAIDFFGLLQHSKGEWAGTPIVLEPWQQFIIWNVFGWQRADRTRRFRTVYESVGRKNGKSTVLAGIGLLLFLLDDEPGAEVYTAATKRDQARIVHLEAVRMVKASPLLKGRITIRNDNLSIAGTASKYVPLGADADTLDGLNSHGVLIDELHAHKTRKLVDVMETSTASRRQPLQYEITTAGYNTESICWEHHEYSIKVLEGIIVDDAWFAYIAQLDVAESEDEEDDDWRDEANWIKANPNLGVSVKLDALRRACKKAREIPAAENTFRRLHCNQWTEQAIRWLKIERWNKCAGAVDPAALVGRRCFAGLDLSKTTDIAALVLLFPPEGDEKTWPVLPFFWVPEISIKARSRDRVPYDAWERAGFIESTDGEVIDYDFIEARACELGTQYQIEEFAYDRMFAHQIVTHLLDEGLTMVPFGQGFLSMGAPTEELERMIIARELAHAGNPVLRWMASNVTVRQDPAGNLKPDKARSRERIDGIVALVMALGRAMVAEEERESVYEKRGALEFG